MATKVRPMKMKFYGLYYTKHKLCLKLVKISYCNNLTRAKSIILRYKIIKSNIMFYFLRYMQVHKLKPQF